MEHLGQYEIHGVIGDGGMGTVYKGRDPRFDRWVAIKVLFDHLAHDAGVLERFKNEAIIEARLQHPNIVTVHDFFVGEDGTAAMVMELVDGQSLEEIIERETGPIPYARCREIFSQVLSAVGYAHEHGLVHRDLKPSNILVQRLGQRSLVKVMDFGVAKILGDEKKRTATSAKMGTLAYAAPEQIRSPRDVDFRADVYSLGCTLYHMATGRVPFDADSEYELMRRVLSEECEPPSAVYPGIGAAFERVIQRAMNKDPQRRHASCDELVRELEAAGAIAEASLASSAPTPAGQPPPRADGPTSPRPSGPIEPPLRHRASPTRVAVLTVGALAVVALIVAAVLGLARGPAPPQSVSAPSATGPSAPRTGQLVLSLSPAGRAILDGWQGPDGGQSDSTSQVFSGLEPRTYTVKAWANGCRTYTGSVTVAAEGRTSLTVRLEPQ